MESYSGAIAGAALFMLRSLDAQHLRAIRRSAFRFWLDYFKTQKHENVKPVFNHLSEGVVPFGFPLRGAGAAQLMKWLRSEGIEAYWWPDLPHHLWTSTIEKLAIIPTHSIP